MISILPFSIFEKSRMSLIIASNELEADLIAAACCRASSSLLSRRINSAIPLMAFIGVRISWDILETKLLLALSAAWAFSIAFTISVSSTKRIFSPATSSSIIIALTVMRQ